MKDFTKRLAAILLAFTTATAFAACTPDDNRGDVPDDNPGVVDPGDDKDPDDGKEPDDGKDGDITDRGTSGPVLTGKAYATPEIANAPAPYGPVPSASQMKYYEQGLSMFVHYGINTFTDKEWGDGNEDPKAFAPTGLNTDQWIETAKNMGFGRVIFTAKHHDGFVNYPTEYTNHSVASSDWLGGKGDVLKEFIDSCAKYEMDAGIYLSPWDRNMPSYSTAVKPAYNDTYVNMIDEIFEKYGNEDNSNIVEFWLDGACGDTSTRPVYDYARWWETIYNHNNDIVIKSEYGSTVHWIGDKECSLSWGGDQVWSTFNKEFLWAGFPDKKPSTNEFNKYINNGTPYIEGKTGKEDANIWSVAEADISIRTTGSGETGAWFWSPTDKTRSAENLVNIYFDSVGKGGVFLLNVPPTRDGVFEKCDLDALATFREILDNTFGTDKAKGAAATADNVRGNSTNFAASNLVDDDYDTYWTTDDGTNSGTVTLDFDSPVYMDVVELQEYIPLGQRIHDFKVEVKVGDQWMDFGSGTTVGYKRLVKGIPVYANALRVTVDGYAVPVLNHIGVYKADSRIEEKAAFTAPGTIDAYQYKTASSTVKRQTKGGKYNVGSIKNGNTVSYEKIFFNGTPDVISFSYAGAGNPAGSPITITARLDSQDGPVIATCALPATGSYYKYGNAEFDVTYEGDISGYHNLWLSFQGGGNAGENAGLNLDSITFAMNDTVSFAAGEVFVDSSSQAAEVKLVRSAATDLPVTVTLGTVDGSGIAGTNYTQFNKTVTFAAGETEKTVAIDLLGFDGIESGLYDFSIVINDVSDGAYIGSLTGAVVTVVDKSTGENFGIGATVATDDSKKVVKASGEKIEEDGVTSTKITVTGGATSASGKIINITNGSDDGFITNGEKQVVMLSVTNDGDADIIIRYYVTTGGNDLTGVTVEIAAGETVEAYFSLSVEQSETPIGCAILLCTNMDTTPITVSGYVIS